MLSMVVIHYRGAFALKSTSCRDNTVLLCVLKCSTINMSLARQLRGRLASWQVAYGRLLSSQTQGNASQSGLPQFFESVDLSQSSANIGLARRRDMSFRQDIRLAVQGQPKSLRDLLKGERIALFGAPDCGKVCSEQHFPGFVAEAENLRKLGITKILCVMVGDAGEAQQWAERLKVDQDKVQIVADTTGSWTRYLGLELNEAGQPGPRSMRYAAVVDDGILLKLRVDQDPGKVEESSATAMVDMLKALSH